MIASTTDWRGELASLAERWRSEGRHRGLTLGRAIQSAADEYPELEIVVDRDEGRTAISLVALQRDAMSLAAGLWDAGLRPGDRIVVQMPNSVEEKITLAAAFLSGFVVVPVTHIYEATELRAIIATVGAAAVVTPARWGRIDFVDRLAESRRPDNCVHIVCGGESTLGVADLHWDDLLRPGEEIHHPPVRAEDLAAVIFTSGTTSGQPKGAMHTHDGLLSRVPVSPATEMLHFSPSPAGHIAGLLFSIRALAAPMPTIFMDSWDAARALQICLDYRPARMNGAPFFIAGLFDEEDRIGVRNDWPTCFHTGGASVAPALIERGAARRRTGWRTYGSSEVPGVTDSEPDVPLDVRAGTDGRAVPGAEIRIVDDDGRDTPDGAEGAVLVRGPQMFVGYYGRDALSAESIGPGGWFRTGDLGRLEDGQLVISGRSKDIVIRGGENISAKEVEDVLVGHSDVVEACVVPVLDDRYGERVGAALRVRDGAAVELDDVRALFSSAGLAIQKTPEFVLEFDEFPRTASGKVLKRELAAIVRARIAKLAP